VRIKRVSIALKTVYFMYEVYKIIILLVVLYRCETWSLLLREHRVRVFENRVLRRIFGSKRDALIGGWRNLHNGELYPVLFAKYI
jgi:hypothetical protein